MKTQFNQGDKVEWSVGTGNAVGTVKQEVTKEIEHKGQTVAASEENPRYLVENDNTGNVTSHKPETLSLKENDDQNLDVGDTVQWNTAQGKTTGTVKERLTDSTQIKDYDVKASKDNPKYLVESEKTGAKAAHKSESLDKVDK